MDGDFRIDVEEVIRKVEQAEVISMYFPMLRKTILIDTRFSDENFPLVKIMPMATSLDERHRLLNKMRPYFPRPKAITVILWPKYVDSLVNSGVWSTILERFAHSRHKRAVEACYLVLEEMYDLELEEFSAVIRGDNYHTLWARH